MINCKIHHQKIIGIKATRFTGMINIQEIIIVNVAGLLVLTLSRLSRIKIISEKHLDDKLLNIMILITTGALIGETLSFLIDGMPGAFVHVLQYAVNFYLFLASCSVGTLWVMYVDYRIYHSLKRIKRRLIPTLLPFCLIAVMLVCDLLGAGMIFSITTDNVYVRGPLVVMSYLVLFYQYACSIVMTFLSVNKNNHVRFFPVLHFVLPCVAGTVVQWMFYGVSVGWFCVSLAFMFVQIHLNNQNACVDDLSGLYNRTYYNFFINKVAGSRKHETISGIMIDVNGFKLINDRFGHTTGDEAIRDLGRIISSVTTERDMAFRHAGDEFIIISFTEDEGYVEQLMSDIDKKIQKFNRRDSKPYKLSLAMGYTLCKTANLNSDNMLHQMDIKMYEAKGAYYRQNGKDRRSDRV